MSIWGYGRCSTDETRQDIDRQIRDLVKMGVARDKVYFEYVSGGKEDKVEWGKLLEQVQDGDTICATEVSRITRSTKQLCDIIEVARTRRIKLIIGGMEIDCSKDDPMSRGMLMMWGVFSELEAAIISQRVKSGMANAKEKGIKIGRPKTSVENLPVGFVRHYPKYAKGDLNVSELARLVGISRQSVYKYVGIIEGG